MNKDIITIGIGGGGINIINDLAHRNLVDSDFLVIDTDLQSLNQCCINEKLLIGERGLGLGFNLSKEELERDLEKIKPDLKHRVADHKAIIVISCLGGKTGSLVILYVLEVIKELQIPSLAICITPFSVENKLKHSFSLSCLHEIDCMKQEKYILKNDDVLNLNIENKPIKECFSLYNEKIVKIINSYKENPNFLKCPFLT